MVDDALKLTIDKKYYKEVEEPSSYHVDGYDDMENMWEKSIYDYFVCMYHIAVGITGTVCFSIGVYFSWSVYFSLVTIQSAFQLYWCRFNLYTVCSSCIDGCCLCMDR